MKKILVRIIFLFVIVSMGVVIFDAKKPIKAESVPFSFLNDEDIKLNNFVPTSAKEQKTYNIRIPDGTRQIGSDALGAPLYEEKYELVATSGSLELYLNSDSLAIAVKNLNNGYVWFSNDPYRSFDGVTSDVVLNYLQAGISMNYYQNNTEKRITSKESKNTITILDNGFKAALDFRQIKIKFDVIVTIDNNELNVKIPYESISEYDENLFVSGNRNNLIKDILVFPFFGSIDKADNGYFVIPDGSGALVNLTEEPKELANFASQIYGRDSGYFRNFRSVDGRISWDDFLIKPIKNFNMPIFSIIHEQGNNGLLTISNDQSAPYAFYNYISRGLDSNYYQSFFRYRYRVAFYQSQSNVDESKEIISYQKTPSKFDLEQTYIILDSEDASYVGAAKVYREKLVNSGILNGDATNYTTVPLKVDILGSEVTEGLFGLKDISITSYEEAIAILEQLQKDGYTDLDVTYKTMAKDFMGFRFADLGILGGKKGLNNLLDYAKENNIDFNIYTDYSKNFVQAYDHRGYKHTASKLNRSLNSTLFYGIYSWMYQVNPRYYSDFALQDINKLNIYGINNIALDNLDNGLFSFYDKRDYSRTEALNFQLDAIKNFIETGIKTSFYNPPSYLYQFTNKYYDAPISSSSLNFTDSDVPFLQLVLSGKMDMYGEVVNFLSDEDFALLRMVEYGVLPSVLLTHESVYEVQYSSSSDIYVSEYEQLHKRLNTYFSKIEDGLLSIKGSELVNHQLLDTGVSLVEYSNGTKIIVNYNDTTYDFNGQTVAAKGYLVQ